MASTRKRKRRYFQSNTGLPAEQDDIITRVEFTRKANRRIRTTSTTVSVPAIPIPPQQHPSSQTPEPSTCDPILGNPPGTVPKKTRKAPSRSIAVRTSPFILLLYRY